MTTAAGAAARRSWTHAEEEALRILSPLGGPACAMTFDRTPDSIRHKAAQLGFSLRRKTYGTRLAHTSPAVLRRVRELSDAMLCPECGFRFVGVATTGCCGVCHLKRLAAVHQEQIEAADAQRELWSARSKLMRRRRKFEAADVCVTETGDAGATMETEQFTDPGEATFTR